MNGIVKIALATIVATFSFVSLSAQTKCCDKETNLRWGVTAGFNGLNGNTLNLSDHRGRYGFNVGARMEYLFRTTPSRMYLDAELGLLKLGWKSSTNDGYYYSDYYKDEAGIQTENWKATMDAYYLHLPIHIGYRWAFCKACALYVDAGPYFSLGLFGKSKVTDLDNKKTTKADTFDEIRRFDWGLGARLGVEVADHYRLGIGYDYGLQKIDKYSNYKNNNFTISVGYMF